MDMGRLPRARPTVVAIAATLAAVTAAAVVGGEVAGVEVSRRALWATLAVSWACLLVLVLMPRTVEAPVGAHDDPTPDRDIDPVTAMPRYESGLDDAHVHGAIGRSWAVLVVAVDAHVATAAIDPGVADALVARAGERIAAVAASYGGIVRRLHGMQFAVIVVGLEEAALSALAAALHDGTAQPATHPLSVGRASGQTGRLVVGVAVAEEGRGEVSQLIRSASVASNQAKRLASDVPVFFHDRLAEEARERIAVGRALSAAIDRRDIDLVFQPQVDLIDGSLLAVEVLARWHDPVFGPIAPDRFVRVAAELGLSRQLDGLIFEKALAQLAEWDANGPRVPRICVNVTPQTISHERTAAFGGELLARHGIAPDRVTVEIMESRVFVGGVGAKVVQRYRDLGLRVALDDFGAGLSSFSQLVSLPVTGLKIDRSLLSDREVDASVLGAIIQAGTALGLSVAAVGIETLEQRDLLVRLGCVVGQGYLYARPLSAPELGALLGAPTPVG